MQKRVNISTYSSSTSRVISSSASIKSAHPQTANNDGRSTSSRVQHEWIDYYFAIWLWQSDLVGVNCRIIVHLIRGGYKDAPCYTNFFASSNKIPTPQSSQKPLQISLWLWSCTRRVICPGDSLLFSVSFSAGSFASSVNSTAKTVMFPDLAVCIYCKSLFYSLLHPRPGLGLSTFLFSTITMHSSLASWY